MLSSSEIAALLAQQNQMFSGQNQFAQQVGVSMPTGFGGQMGQPLNMGPRPGFTAGNSFAGTAMSGMGGLASAAGVGVGALGMFGKLGPLAPLVDPFSAASMGFRMGGIGMGMGMGAMAMVPGMMASRGMQAFVQGGQGQMMVQNQLAQNFQQNNPMARGGTGFSRDDAMAIGNQVRSLAHIPEMMTSVEELTKLLPKLKSMGVMQGVKDATEFSQRFKDAVKTIRDVSRMLGSSMEEATQFFEHSRSVGFLGRKDQLKNVLNSQFTSGVTGMSMGQVAGMQQAGAGIAQQFGARRSLGVEAVTNISQSLGMAQREGRFHEGALEDLTGLQGSEAIQASAQMFTDSMTRVGLGTASGRAIIAGSMKMVDGKAVLDRDIIDKVKRGEMGWSELKSRGMNLSNKEKISFTNRAEDLSMELAGQLGPGGFAGFMDEVAGNKGEEAVKLLLRRNAGVSATGADVMMDMAGQAGTGDQERSMMARIRSRESQISERTDPKKIIERLKTKLHAKAFGGLEQAGAQMFNDLGRVFDEFIDDVVGRHVVKMSEDGVKNLSKAFASGGDQSGVRDMFEAASGLTSGPSMKLGNTGSAMDSLSGITAFGGNTGNSASGDFRANAFKFGGTYNMSIDEAAGAMKKNSASAVKAGDAKKKEVIAGRIAMQELIEELGPAFEEATDAQKRLMLEEKLSDIGIRNNKNDTNSQSGNYGADGNRRRAALLGAVKGMEDQGHSFSGVSLSASLIQGLGTGGIGEDRTDRVSRSLDSIIEPGLHGESVKAIQARIKGSIGKLREADFGEDVIGFLGQDGAQGAILKASQNSTRVDEILKSNVSNEKKSELLKTLGIHVDPDSIDVFKKSVHKMSKTSDGQSLLSEFGKERAFSDLEMMKGVVEEAGLEIGSSSGAFGDLKSATRAFSKATTKDQLVSAQADISKQIEAITKMAQDAKTPEEREAILQMAGKFGVGIGGAMGASRRLIGKNVSQEDVAKEFGVGVGDISQSLKENNIGINGGKLTESAFKEIQRKVASARAGGGLVTEGKVQQAGDKDEQVVRTLKELDLTMKKTNSLIALQLGGGTAEKAREMLGMISETGGIKKEAK